MSTHCRHGMKDQSASYGESKIKNTGYSHIIDQNFAPEKHFEPWHLSDSLKHGNISRNSTLLNESSFSER